MKKSFIIGALLVIALLGGISYGYATYSDKKNSTSNEKIYSELDAKMSKAENTKDNDKNTQSFSNKNKEKNKEKKSNSKCEKNKSIQNKSLNNELTNEEKEIIKLAEKHEGVIGNTDIRILIGDKKDVNGEKYYHIHMVSKKLINEGGSGTVDDFYINKYGKVLKNADETKCVNDNNIKSKIINLAEKYEGTENNKDIVIIIFGSKEVKGEKYYHVHMTSKKLINEGGSGTIDDFYINEKGKVLKM